MNALWTYIDALPTLTLAVWLLFLALGIGMLWLLMELRRAPLIEDETVRGIDGERYPRPRLLRKDVA